MRGTVLFFNKTYGFIRCDTIEEDIFFHFKSITSIEKRRELCAGDVVDFDLEEGSNARASKVREVDEVVEGKKLLKAHIFNIENGEFELKDFYFEVISKIPVGLKHVTIVGESMIATSLKVDLDIAIEIVMSAHKPGTYSKILKDYTLRFI